MSLSLISRLLNTRNCHESMGLVIGRSTIACSHVVRTRNNIDVIEYLEKALSPAAFGKNPTRQVIDSLNAALLSICSSKPQKYIPLHVSLPDAALHIEVLEFDSMPKQPNEQRELIAWRMRQEKGLNEIVCANQYLGTEGNKHLVLALAADMEWYEVVTSQLKNANLVGWSISADIFRKFNQFHGKLVLDSGALISLNQDCWSLLIWDCERRVRYSRSYWRTCFDDYSEITSEIERAIIAYVNNGEHRSVARIYVTTEAQDTTFSEIINSRLSEPCASLDPLSGVGLARLALKERNYLAGTVSAALER